MIENILKHLSLQGPHLTELKDENFQSVGKENCQQQPLTQIRLYSTLSSSDRVTEGLWNTILASYGIGFPYLLGFPSSL